MLIITYVCFPDINECNGSHECSQNCHNQLGWYSCSCRKGFLLKLDFKQCEGMSVDMIC